MILKIETIPSGNQLKGPMTMEACFRSVAGIVAPHQNGGFGMQLKTPYRNPHQMMVYLI